MTPACRRGATDARQPAIERYRARPEPERQHGMVAPHHRPAGGQKPSSKQPPWAADNRRDSPLIDSKIKGNPLSLRQPPDQRRIVEHHTLRSHLRLAAIPNAHIVARPAAVSSSAASTARSMLPEVLSVSQACTPSQARSPIRRTRSQIRVPDAPRHCIKLDASKALAFLFPFGDRSSKLDASR